MTSPMTADDYLRIVERSGLLGPDQLTPYADSQASGGEADPPFGSSATAS